MSGCVTSLVIINIILSQFVISNARNNNNNKQEVSTWQGIWNIFPTSTAWSLQTRIPMTTAYQDTDGEEEGRGKFKVKKKLKKFMLPLLLAYKLKFFTLIPVMIGGLILLIGSTGLAGFFFALFAAVMGLKGGTGH